MHGAIIVAEIQIIGFTLSLFIFLGLSHGSTLRIFVSFLNWFVITQPLLTYCYIFLGVVCEESEMACALKRTEEYIWSGLLHINSKWLLHRHYIYPLIVCGCSCGISFTTSYYLIVSAVPGVVGLGVCLIVVPVSFKNVVVGIVTRDVTSGVVGQDTGAGLGSPSE